MSFLLAIGAVLTAASNMPSDKNITSFHVYEIENRERELKAIAKGGNNEVPGRLYGTVEEIKAYIAQENKEYAQRISELPGEKRDIILAFTALWLFVCAGIYAMGWLVAWVIRGFRPKTA